MKNGPYVLIVPPENYPGKWYRGKYAYEHHVVWWKHTGQTLPPGHVLHHKNEKKTDNQISNLELKTVGVHNAEHSSERGAGCKLIACGWCKNKFTITIRRWNFGKRRGRKLFFCSRSHAVKHQQSQRVRRIDHGTYGSYRKGCRCDQCRAANALRMRNYFGRM